VLGLVLQRLLATSDKGACCMRCVSHLFEASAYAHALESNVVVSPAALEVGRWPLASRLTSVALDWREKDAAALDSAAAAALPLCAALRSFTQTMSATTALPSLLTAALLRCTQLKDPHLMCGAPLGEMEAH